MYNGRISSSSRVGATRSYPSLSWSMGDSGKSERSRDLSVQSVHREHNVQHQHVPISSLPSGKDKPVLPKARRERWALYLRHTFNEIMQRKLNFCLGAMSCFIVVAVVSLTVTALYQAPVVFLSLAEADAGENDLKVSAGTWTGNTLVNYTRVATELAAIDNPEFQLHTPRHEFQLPFYKLPANLNVDPYNQTWMYGDATSDACARTPNSFTANCVAEKLGALGASPVEGTLFLMDLEREAKIKFGRSWPYNTNLKTGEAYMHERVARGAGVQVGDIILLQVNGYARFRPLFELAGYSPQVNLTTAALRLHTDTVWVPLKVVKLFDFPYGKFGTSTTDAIIADFDSWLPWMAGYVNDQVFHPDFYRILKQHSTAEFAQDVYFNLPNRLEEYLEPNFDVIQGRLVKFGSLILYQLGYNQLNPSMPLLSGLAGTQFFNLFLGLLLNIIVTILTALSIILIYSLLMISVETRTFEMGVMRMVGMTRRGVVELLMVQAFSYSLPAYALGLVAAQAGAFAIADAFRTATGVEVSPWLSASAVLNATLLGVLIPIAASILPIRNALGLNLHDALDVKRSKTSGVKYNIERSASSRLDFSVIGIGLLLSAFGFFIYYMFPLALLSFDLGLLLNIFFVLILGMLLGLVMLSLNLQHLLERLVTRIFFFWEAPAVQSVVVKNLIAHRSRNRKTTIMYALALGFIIFIAVAFNTSITSITYDRQQSRGVYLRVEARGRDAQGLPNTLPTPTLYEEVLKADKNVKGWAWETWPLSSLPSMDTTQNTNLGKSYSDVATYYGISPHMFNVTIPGFLVVNEEDTSSKFDIEEQLYTVNGSSGGMIGTLYKERLGLSMNSHLLLRSQLTQQSPLLPVINYTRVHADAFLDAAPAHRFSAFPSRARQDVLVSIPTWFRLSKGLLDSMDSVPLRLLYVQIDPSLGDAQRDALISNLKGVTVKGFVRLWDYRESVRPLETARLILNAFFGFTTVVAMTVCFFSLMASMYTNIFEQSKEIGVMRALGVGKWWIVRLYIYEAYVLVFSSSLLGMVIGTLVGWTMTLQRQLFTQLPIAFEFPWELMGLVVVLSMIFAVVSAFGPAKQLIEKPIVSIMRVVT